MVAKKYMGCHDNVVNWNDSAGEEAFHNAKRRFWALINGLTCDNPLPDPDMYNGKNDWNPVIDPELISDLERAYFNPDEAVKFEAEKSDKAQITNRKDPDLVPSGPASGWDEKNHGNGDSPWENNSRILENVNNPWVKAQSDRAPKESLWVGGGNKSWGDGAWGGGGTKSWGWNRGRSSTEKTTPDNNYGHSWGCGSQNAGSVKGWDDARNNSGGPTHWGTNGNRSWNTDKGENSWKNQPSGGGPVDRRWQDSGDNSWGWKHQESQNNEPRNFEYRGPNGDGRAINVGCRKREGPPQNNTSRYKSSRFQREDFGVSQQWGHQRNQKKVSFVQVDTRQ